MDIRTELKFPPLRLYRPRVTGLVFLLIAAWGVVYYLRFFDQKLLPGDEGVALMNGWRISMGEVPHRDFFIIVPPASFLPTAAVFKIFGPSLAAGRTLAFFMALLLVILLDLFLKKAGADFFLRVFSAVLLIPYGVSYWPLPSHHWWCDIFCLAASLFFLRSESDGAKVATNSLLSGVFGALAAWTLQDQGSYFLIMIGLYFLYKVFGKKCEPAGACSANELKKGFSAFLLGVFSVSALFLTWLIPTVGIDGLYQDLVAFPIFSYHNLEGHQTGPVAGWLTILQFLSAADFSKAPIYFVSMASTSLVLLLLPLAAVSGLIATKYVAFGSSRARWAIASLLFSFLLASLHRWSFTNLVWALPGILPALAPLFEKRLRTASRWTASIATVAVLTFSACFFSLASPRRMTSICGRAGCIRAFSSPDSRALAELAGFLDTNAGDGDTLFTGGFKGLVNFVALMPNPTPFNDFVDYNTDRQLETLSSSLREKKVEWAVLTRQASGANAKLEKMVEDGGYSKVFENRSYRVYRRK